MTLQDALTQYMAAQAARITEEGKLRQLVDAQTQAHAAFNTGATLTTGPTVLPKPVNDLRLQMQAAQDQADRDVQAQSVVVSQAYQQEQQLNQDLRNLLLGSLNVGAGSIT